MEIPTTSDSSTSHPLGYAILNDAGPTPFGSWMAPLAIASTQRIRGGSLTIPDWFADTYLDGRSLGVGFGTSYSGFASCSKGPFLDDWRAIDAWRVDEDVILITATCLPKGEHQPQDVVVIDASGRRLAGSRQPTGELPIYLSCFRERPDIRSIVHCHPPCCGALVIRDGDDPLMRPLFPEVVLEIGPLLLVPYATPLFPLPSRS